VVCCASQPVTHTALTDSARRLFTEKKLASGGVLRAFASIGMALSSQLRFELPAGIRAGFEQRLVVAATQVHSSRRSSAR